MRKWPKHRVKEIIDLLDVHKMTPKQVARELGISVWTVYRANKKSKRFVLIIDR